MDQRDRERVLDVGTVVFIALVIVGSLVMAVRAWLS
jgi:hypothetical protein